MSDDANCPTCGAQLRLTEAEAKQQFVGAVIALATGNGMKVIGGDDGELGVDVFISAGKGRAVSIHASHREIRMNNTKSSIGRLAMMRFERAKDVWAEDAGNGVTCVRNESRQRYVG